MCIQGVCNLVDVCSAVGCDRTRGPPVRCCRHGWHRPRGPPNALRRAQGASCSDPVLVHPQASSSTCGGTVYSTSRLTHTHYPPLPSPSLPPHGGAVFWMTAGARPHSGRFQAGRVQGTVRQHPGDWYGLLVCECGCLCVVVTPGCSAACMSLSYLTIARALRPSHSLPSAPPVCAQV